MTEFELSRDYQFGRIGEGVIARWFRRRGHAVLPVYEKEISDGKGPRLFMPKGQLIAPDMAIFLSKMVSPDMRVMFVEAKRKSAFTQLRKANRYGVCGAWQTGIDERHYEDYCKVETQTGVPVWLLFLQEGGQAKDSPPDSPSGLYGQALSALKEKIDHRHPNPPPRFKPMVYWNIDDLALLATLEELRGAHYKGETQ
jgi:hypothetical protein